jgi:putative transposase
MEVVRRHGITAKTYYRWKAKFAGMNVSEDRRLRQLEEENSRLKRLVAEQALDNSVLKDLIKNSRDGQGSADGRYQPYARERDRRARARLVRLSLRSRSPSEAAEGQEHLHRRYAIKRLLRRDY